MRLAWLELRDFRNHRDTRVEVPDGVIVAVGPNGEGKTNLLEGMYYLFTLVSPRVSATQPLVREGADAGYVRGEVVTREGRVLVEIEIPQGRASRVKVDRSPVRRKRDLRRRVRAVFFGPDDLDIVRGEPSHRRRFLDEAVTTLWPLKESLISAFDRALRQRNRLLKEHEGGGPPPGIEAWDEELVVAGTALTRARADAVTRVAPRAEDEFLALSGYGLEVSYARNVPEGEPLEEAYRSRIAERRADEVLRRTTLVGPHRDDVALAVRDLGARAFASHGEAWGAALALRMGLAAAAGEELGEPPVWLLDDPFSALDPGRRRNVAERLVDRGQVVVSVADEAHVPAIDATVWDLRAGSVSPRAGVGRGTGP